MLFPDLEPLRYEALYRGIEGDTSSLDYSPCSHVSCSPFIFAHRHAQVLSLLATLLLVFKSTYTKVLKQRVVRIRRINLGLLRGCPGRARPAMGLLSPIQEKVRRNLEFPLNRKVVGSHPTFLGSLRLHKRKHPPNGIL